MDPQTRAKVSYRALVQSHVVNGRKRRQVGHGDIPLGILLIAFLAEVDCEGTYFLPLSWLNCDSEREKLFAETVAGVRISDWEDHWLGPQCELRQYILNKYSNFLNEEPSEIMAQMMNFKYYKGISIYIYTYLFYIIHY